MSIFEAALRGGAVTVLLLLAALLLREWGRAPAARSSTLFALSTAGYVVCSIPEFDRLGLPFGLPLLVVSLGLPALFWMAAAATFDDGFRPSWHRGLAWLGLVALGLWSIFAGERLVDLAYYALSLWFVGLGAWHALKQGEDDIVEARRGLRILVTGSTALFSAASIIVNVLSPGSLLFAPLSLFNAAGLVAMAFGFAMTRLAIVRQAPAVPTEVDRSRVDRTQPAPRGDEQETALLAALRRLMDDHKLYRQDRLSIALLAARLGAPEYRVRRLINRRLGHRNFASFINGYRIAEARAALADPHQAQVPILTIAFDAGFQSLAPFNRAFKLAAGMTPTEYRRQRLSVPEPGAT